MAGELQVSYTTGSIVYAIMRSAVGTVVKVSDGTLVAYATANYSQYPITLTEQGTASGYYVGNVPSGVAAGNYSVTAYKRVGGSAAEGDTVIGAQAEFQWSGSVIVPLYHAPVDVDTIKTQAVTCGASVTVRADLGAVAAPGSANGMLIGGSNAATTFATLTVTGAVAFQSTFAVTTSTSLAALSCTTLTASGAVTFQSTFGITGTMTVNAFTCTNAFTVSGNWLTTGTTTWTGTATFTAGLTANITGNLIGTVSTLTTYTGNTVQSGDIFARVGVTGSGLTSITAKTNLIPAVPAAVGSAMTFDMTQAVPTGNTAQTVGDAFNAARAQGFGKWVITGTSLALYAGDGTTIVRTFTLDSVLVPTSRT